MTGGETNRPAAAHFEKCSRDAAKTAYLPGQTDLLTFVFLRLVKIHLSFIMPDMNAALPAADNDY